MQTNHLSSLASSSSPSPGKNQNRQPKSTTRIVLGVILIFALVVLLTGTIRNPNFWQTPEQRGEALLRAKKFADAAKVFRDPWRIGMAQYRNGDFEAAAKTFPRVPGANGAFDQGNAWLMHGNYDAAIASYDRALSLHPAWKKAEENKAVAIARKAKLEAASENREAEQTDAYKPDEIVFDLKKNDTKGKPVELAEGNPSDNDLRASWLRRVQTTPGDFLRAKFAYQAAETEQPEK